MSKLLKLEMVKRKLFPAGVLMLLVFNTSYAFPTSGTCAMLATFPVPYGGAIPTTKGYNVLATLTFTNATGGSLSYNLVKAKYTTDGVQFYSTESDTIQFTLKDSPNLAGAKQLQFVTNDQKGTALNLFAVNGDRTLLVQGESEPLGGVCQF